MVTVFMLLFYSNGRSGIDLVSLDSYRAVLVVPYLLRLEVWLAEMLPIVLCLVQVYLVIGKSKTVNFL